MLRVNAMTNLRGQEEDEYLDKVTELSERLSGDDPDECIRQIAREEAHKRLFAFLGPVLFIAAPWRAQRQMGRNPSLAAEHWDGG